MRLHEWIVSIKVMVSRRNGSVQVAGKDVSTKLMGQVRMARADAPVAKFAGHKPSLFRIMAKLGGQRLVAQLKMGV